MNPAHLDPDAERERYLRRGPLLARQAALRLGLGEGLTFQPETRESVEDLVRETLWAEGVSMEAASPEDLAEVRASFAILAPGRESLTATLSLAFPESIRDRRLDALRGFPEGLFLRLSTGDCVAPLVDRGAAGPDARLPSVLALRYRVPAGARPVALVSHHAEAPGVHAAPAAWAGWIEDTAPAP